MLIFDSKKGRFGTQKPKQWGPLSVVRSAMFRNAEAAGVDPQTLCGYYPMWEGFGQVTHDVVSGDTVALRSNSTLTTAGFSTDTVTTSAGLIITKNTKIKTALGSSNHRSWFYTIRPDVGAAMGNRSLSEGSEGFSGTEVFSESSASGSDWRITGGVSASQSVSTSYMAVGAEKSVFFTWDGATIRLYINGEQIASRASTTVSVNSGAYIHLFGVLSYAPSNIISNHAGIANTALSPSTVARFHDTPFFLLQPNPAPIYFDSAATGTSGSLTAPSLSATPTITAGTLSGAQAGALVAPSLSVVSSITAGSLSAALSGSLTAPSLSVQPTITAGSLAGAQDGTLAAPSLSITPTITAGILAGVQTGTLTAPSLSVMATISAGTLAGAQSGGLTAPSLSIAPTITAGSLLGEQSGDLVAPSISIAPSITAGQLQGSGTGILNAPSLYVAPTITAGTLSGAQDGALTAPTMTVAPMVSAGSLAAINSGALTAPSLSIQPVISAGSLVGIATSSGSLTAPDLSIQPVISAGTLFAYGAGLGIITDPTILSLTPQRTTLSTTPVRTAKHV